MNRPMSIAGSVATLFGLATIASGGVVLFGNESARTTAGDYVPFVVWFNFISGFAYVAVGAGLFLVKRWSALGSAVIALAIAAVFAALVAYVLNGGAYELRTIVAMSLRLGFWAVATVIACRTFSCLPTGFSHAN